LNGNGAVINRFIRGVGLIRSEHHGWYIVNGQNDVVQRVSDAVGVGINSSITILHSYRYNAFGQEQNQHRNSLNPTGLPQPQNTNPHRYRSKVYDHEVGRIATMFRQYCMETGRWTQEDPYWGSHNLQSSPMESGNLYAYVKNNPVYWIDPLGLSAEQPTYRGLRLEGTTEIRNRMLEYLQMLTNYTLTIDANGMVSMGNRQNQNRGQTLTYGNTLMRSIIDSRFLTSIDHERNHFGGGSVRPRANGTATPGTGSGSGAIIIIDLDWAGTEYAFIDPRTGRYFYDHCDAVHILLAHELIHAERYSRGARVISNRSTGQGMVEFGLNPYTVRRGIWPFRWNERRYERRVLQPREELLTIGLLNVPAGIATENRIRAEHGLPLRAYWN